MWLTPYRLSCFPSALLLRYSTRGADAGRQIKWETRREYKSIWLIKQKVQTGLCFSSERITQKVDVEQRRLSCRENLFFNQSLHPFYFSRVHHTSLLLPARMEKQRTPFQSRTTSAISLTLLSLSQPLSFHPLSFPYQSICSTQSDSSHLLCEAASAPLAW